MHVKQVVECIHHNDKEERRGSVWERMKFEIVIDME